MQQRVFIMAFCFLAIAVGCCVRFLFAMALVGMIKPKINFTQEVTYDYCFDIECANIAIHDDEIQMDWTENEIGLIIGSFSISWIFFQIPFGVIADLYPKKYICGIGMICASVLTLCIPYAIKTEDDFLSIVIMRLATGFFEGPLLCSINSIISKWFPNDEIWLVSGIIYSGIPFGVCMFSLFGGYTMYHTNEWTTIFIGLGIIGIIFYVLFIVIVYDTPEFHPWISQQEKDYLAANLEKQKTLHLNDIPWRKIFKNEPLRGLLLSRFGVGFGFNILLNYMPQYISNVLCLGLPETIIYTTVPLACAFTIGILSSAYAHTHTKPSDFSNNTLRKLYFALASVGPAIFMLVGSFLNCNKIGVLILFSVAMFGLGFYVVAMYTNEVTLSRTYCGTLTGVTNTVSGIVDTFGPLMTGLFTNTDSITEWRLVYWICFMLFNACSLPYMLWGSQNEQNFDKSDSADGN